MTGERQGVMFNLSNKAKRDLLAKMSFIRNTDGCLVVQRNYTYDQGKPLENGVFGMASRILKENSYTEMRCHIFGRK